MNPIPTPSKRLISLDALRGFTIAGMILVNVPGSWSHIYAPFSHAEFNGLTLADLVFPFFLFIVGASIVLALKKRMEKKLPKSELLKKIVVRTIIIFVLGVFLNWMSSRFSGELRIAGVLQRIALCYLAGSLLFLYTTKTVQIVTGGLILIGYWILTMFVPVPGEGAVVFTPEMNWTAWVDGVLLPGKMYFQTWDPEGILSTLPSIVTTLTGIFAMLLISAVDNKISKVKSLLIYGAGLLVAGILLSSSFPVNKNVWSSSYVLVTSGLASLLWGALIYIIDIKNKTKWTKPGVIFGANAITAYVLHYLMFYPLGEISIWGMSIQKHFMLFFSGFIPQELASLFWAILYTSICFIPIYWMYKKKIFVKV